MKAVLDASILVRAVITGQDFHQEIRTWLTRIEDPIAPYFMPFETVTAIRRLEAAGLLSSEDSDMAVMDALRLKIALKHSRKLLSDSLQLARDLGMSRTRDTAYLALAIQEGCTMYTVDERFIRNAGRKGFPVRHPTKD